MLRLPDGGDHDVGLARVERRGRGVSLWQMVTVALACKSSIAIGLPTILLRPITTACLPRRDAGALDQLHAAVRRAGPEARRPGHQHAGAAHGSRRHPCAARSPRSPCAGRYARGSGICTRMPWIFGSAFSAAMRASSSASPSVGVVFLEHRMDAAVFAGLDLVAHVDLRWPGRRRPGSRPARAVRRARRARRRAGRLRRGSVERAVPSMSCAVMAFVLEMRRAASRRRPWRLAAAAVRPSIARRARS